MPVSMDFDTTEVRRLAQDLDKHARRTVRTATERALTAGIEYVYVNALASAAPLRDTGLMLESIHKDNGTKGSARRVYCGPDAAGFMNEFGTTRMPPRPWLFKHAEGGAKLIETGLAQIADTVLAGGD